MIRLLAKTGIACGLRWSGAGLLQEAMDGRRGAPWVLGYHRVVEDFSRSARDSIAALLISRATLERHLDWIGRRYEFASLDEIGSRLERQEASGPPAAAVTFDDGYSDVYHQAFPLLKRKGIPAAVFVVTDHIGTSRVLPHDRLQLLLARAFSVWASPAEDLPRVLRGAGIRLPGNATLGRDATDPHGAMRLILEALPQDEVERAASCLETEVTIEDEALTARRPMTWEMLLEMSRAGITIGSHGRTHRLLTRESEAKVLGETAGSRSALEARLGFTIRHFAYPNGWFDATTTRAVGAAGYRYAYTACRHRDSEHPLLTIPRTLLWENSARGPLGRFSPALMRCQASGTFNRLSGCRLDHGTRSWAVR